MRCLKRVGAVWVLAAYAAAGSIAATSVSVIVSDASGVLVDAVVSLKPARSATPSAAKTADMDQINSQFLPAVLAVRAGTVARFPNSDQIRHQVYPFSLANRYKSRP